MIGAGSRVDKGVVDDEETESWERVNIPPSTSHTVHGKRHIRADEDAAQIPSGD